MRTLATRAVLAAALATLALACGQPRHPRPATQPSMREPMAANPPQRPFNEPLPQQPTVPEPRAQAPIEQPQPQKPFYGPGTTPEGPKAKTEKPLTDAEVVGAADAANKGEVQMADVALKQAHSPEVKKYAQLMKTTHQKALEGDKKLEHKDKLAAAESDLSTMLKSDVEKTIKDLGDKKGKDFDRAYMDAAVKTHKEVLTAIDDRLMPSAQNPDVKTMVTNMRGVVSDHLTKAEDVVKKMESGATSSQEKAKAPGKAKAKEPMPPKAKEPKPAEPILKPVPPEK